MMKDFLNIDNWWKVMLIGGCALIAISLLFQVDIVNRKHLLGIGIGMFIVGIANLMAIKTLIENFGHGFFHGQVPIHNTFTKVMQAIGFIITIGFGGLLLWGLV